MNTSSHFIIEEFNSKILKKIDYIKLLRFKDFLKKVNNKSEINFQPKKNLIIKFLIILNLKTNLSYGRMNFIKKLSAQQYHCPV